MCMVYIDMRDLREKERNKMEMDQLQAVKVVGKGAMGTVFLVKKDGCEEPLALKAMSKSVMAKKGDGLRRAQIEKDILSSLEHPFLPALVGHVETEKMMGWVVDYCPGGDLNALRHRQTEKAFSESIIRFYAAEIVLALEHLHGLGIVYRDLKPENVLIQSNGHIMLTDFDLSTRLSPRRREEEEEREEIVTKQRPRGRVDSVVTYFKKAASTKQQASKVARSSSARVSPVLSKASKDKEKIASQSQSQSPSSSSSASPSTSTSTSTSTSSPATSGRLNSFVGTEEYVSPEVVKGTGHEFAVDWWALGVLLYEMHYGNTPFKGANRKETFFNILAKNPQFMGPSTPLRGLIDRLLKKDPEKRLGSSSDGAADVKNHAFFRGVNWHAVQHVYRTPFVPPLSALPTNGRPINIEECVEELQADMMTSAKLSEGVNEGAAHNWVERLSKSREGNAFGVF